jgi:hypothetical protein
VPGCIFLRAWMSDRVGDAPELARGLPSLSTYPGDTSRFSARALGPIPGIPLASLPEPPDLSRGCLSLLHPSPRTYPGDTSRFSTRALGPIPGIPLASLTERSDLSRGCLALLYPSPRTYPGDASRFSTRALQALPLSYPSPPPERSERSLGVPQALGWTHATASNARPVASSGPSWAAEIAPFAPTLSTGTCVHRGWIWRHLTAAMNPPSVSK